MKRKRSPTRPNSSRSNARRIRRMAWVWETLKPSILHGEKMGGARITRAWGAKGSDGAESHPIGCSLGGPFVI
jgi:hypothetical protein